MLSIGKLKFLGTVAHLIGVVLNSLLIFFAFYLGLSKNGLLGVVILDSYLGATGIVFGLAGIYAIISMNSNLLSLNKAYPATCAFFSVGSTVIHTLIPLYHTFEKDAYVISNAFYVVAFGFILTFFQSLYIYFISYNVQKFKASQTEEEDLEANTPSKKSMDLNDTTTSMKAVG